MPITKIRFIFLSVVLSFPIIAGKQYDIHQAEALFNKRGEGIGVIEKSKKMFLSLVKDEHQPLAHRQKALDRFARLSVLEAELGKEQNHIKHPAKIFSLCLDATEYLNPKIVHEMLPEYTYWRSICLGLWAANASVVQLLRPRSMGYISEFKKLVNYGFDHFPTFDSYGFHRLYAGMYLRSKALTMLNLYHPEKALTLIETPINHGTTIYLDYLLKAEALWALERHDEAREVLQASINELKQRMDQETLPDDITVESEYFLSLMENALSTWL